jgi:hypothetical protein
MTRARRVLAPVYDLAQAHVWGLARFLEPNGSRDSLPATHPPGRLSYRKPP